MPLSYQIPRFPSCRSDIAPSGHYIRIRLHLVLAVRIAPDTIARQAKGKSEAPALSAEGDGARCVASPF
jgi:hypothetical protein